MFAIFNVLLTSVSVVKKERVGGSVARPKGLGVERPLGVLFELFGGVEQRSGKFSPQPHPRECC